MTRNKKPSRLLTDEESPGLWRTTCIIPGFPAYNIDERGNVYCLHQGTKGIYPRRPRQLGTHTNKHGYVVVGLTASTGGEWGKLKLQQVHRLVALAYIGKPPHEDLIVCHKDGNPGNNYYRNLYWGTQQDNSDDQAWHKEHGKGKRCSVRP